MSKTKKFLAIAVALLVVLVAVVVVLGRPNEGAPTTAQGIAGMGYSDMTGLRVTAPTVASTAQPALIVDQKGLGVLVDFKDGGTPEASIGQSGFSSTTWTLSAEQLTSTDDAQVADTLDVNGDIDLDGDGFDVNITAGFSIDADAASNINVAGSGIDLTLESEAGRLVLKGDEAAADAVTIDADDAAGTGVTIQSGATAGVVFSGGAVTLPRKVLNKTGVTVALTAAEVSWTIVTDLGDTGAITFTLPTAVAGYEVLLFNQTGNDWIIDTADGADTIFDLTNAAGNKITNSTAYDYVHLIALDATGYWALDVHGTWTDAD